MAQRCSAGFLTGQSSPTAWKEALHEINNGMCINFIHKIGYFEAGKGIANKKMRRAVVDSMQPFKSEHQVSLR